MKNWEDIVKDKLEGYESTLPEGSLADFRARRDAAGRSSATRRSPLLWIVPAAVAASLAAFLFLRNPGSPDDDIQTTRQPAETIAVVTDSTDTPEIIETIEPMPSQPLIAQAAAPKSNRQPAASHQESETVVETETLSESEPAAQQPEQATEAIDTDTQTETTGQAAPAQETETQPTTRPTVSPVTTPDIPYFPEVSTSKSIGLKVGSAVGIVAGGGLLAMASPYLVALVKPTVLKEEPSGVMDVRLAFGSALSDAYYGAYNSSGLPGTKDHSYPTYPPGQIQIDPKPAYDYTVTEAEHDIPLKVGLSTRIPISEKLALTTGLNYSMYSSKVSLSYNESYRYNYSRTQHAHYLGIPVRLDWMLASGRWLDVYLGGGFQGDYCLGATLNKDKMETKDGLTFSMLGAGGVQLNLGKRAGIYLEPEISWTPHTEGQLLSTYRKENPLMFTVATGIRINLCNE